MTRVLRLSRLSPILLAAAFAVLATLFAHAAPPASAQQEESDTVAVVRTVLVSNFGQDRRTQRLVNQQLRAHAGVHDVERGHDAFEHRGVHPRDA